MNAKHPIAFTVALTILLSALALPSAVDARVRVGVGIRVGAPPPALRHEVVVVRPGPEFVWIRGHWDWVPAARNYVWVPGAWVLPPRARAAWVEPRYERRGRGHFFIAGHWKF